MADISQLALFAQRFKYVFPFLYDAVSGNGWQEADGFRFIDVQKTQRITETLYGLSPELHPLITDIELSLIHVTGTIKPHKHHLSDAAVLVDPNLHWTHSERYGFMTPGFWERVEPGQLFVIPRGTPHGFKVDRSEGTQFYLLAINWPPLPQGDIEYV